MNQINLGGLSIDVVICVVALTAVLYPIHQPARGDLGDGMGKVRLPTPGTVSSTRVLGFVATSTLFAFGAFFWLATVRHFYQAAINAPVQWALPKDPEILSFTKDLPVLYPVFVSLGLILVSLFQVAPIERRILSALYSFARFWLLVIVSTAVVAVLCIELHITPLVYLWIEVSLITLGGLGLLVSTFQTDLMLPRPTLLSFSGDTRWRDFNLVMASIAISGTLSVAVFVVLARSIQISGTVAIFGPLFALPMLSTGSLSLLFVLAPAPKRGKHLGFAPTISVITPAWNEEVIIERCLASIDRAASKYPGRVNVVLADDGSTDRTVERVLRAYNNFSHATGTLVTVAHQGKAAALNAALNAAESEIIVRIDADTVIDENAFVPLPDWFANPKVGMVGALDVPRTDQPAWYTYGRLFECLRSFGFGRLAQQRVNGIVCIPGTFTAFRGPVARSVGGFVEVMNGEDADLTIQFQRLGFVVVVDTDIIIYEDVPQTWQEFRKQRVRWFRAGTQLAARHFTFRRGNVSSTMLFAVRMMLSKLEAALHPTLIFGATAFLFFIPGASSKFIVATTLALFSGIPAYLVLIVLTFRYGYGRSIVWLPIVIPFSIAKRLAAIESTMTIPSRAQLGAWTEKTEISAAEPVTISIDGATDGNLTS